MGLYSIIPGFCGAPWAVGAPRVVTTFTFHPTSNGPAVKLLSILLVTLFLRFALCRQSLQTCLSEPAL